MVVVVVGSGKDETRTEFLFRNEKIRLPKEAVTKRAETNGSLGGRAKTAWFLVVSFSLIIFFHNYLAYDSHEGGARRSFSFTEGAFEAARS